MQYSEDIGKSQNWRLWHSACLLSLINTYLFRTGTPSPKKFIFSRHSCRSTWSEFHHRSDEARRGTSKAKATLLETVVPAPFSLSQLRTHKLKLSFFPVGRLCYGSATLSPTAPFHCPCRRSRRKWSLLLMHASLSTSRNVAHFCPPFRLVWVLLQIVRKQMH